MAKRSDSKQAAAKPAANQPADSFVELMLVAADFVKSCGGVEQAKKSLEEAGKFIERAGSVSKASKALSVLENLKDRIAS